MPAPRGCPRAGSGAPPLAAERSRPTAPAMMWLPHYLACVGASTGALPLAVVDAIPGDPEGPRAGAHGCATFLSLVSLSPKASLAFLATLFCLLTTTILAGNLRRGTSYAVQSYSSAYSLRADNQPELPS